MGIALDGFSTVLGTRRGTRREHAQAEHARQERRAQQRSQTLARLSPERAAELEQQGRARLEDYYGENAMDIIAAVRDVLVRGCTLLGERRRGRQLALGYTKEALGGDYVQLIEVSREYLREHLGIETEPYTKR